MFVKSYQNNLTMLPRQFLVRQLHARFYPPKFPKKMRRGCIGFNYRLFFAWSIIKIRMILRLGRNEHKPLSETEMFHARGDPVLKWSWFDINQTRNKMKLGLNNYWSKRRYIQCNIRLGCLDLLSIQAPNSTGWQWISVIMSRAYISLLGVYKPPATW